MLRRSQGAIRLEPQAVGRSAPEVLRSALRYGHPPRDVARYPRPVERPPPGPERRQSLKYPLPPHHRATPGCAWREDPTNIDNSLAVLARAIAGNASGEFVVEQRRPARISTLSHRGPLHRSCLPPSTPQAPPSVHPTTRLPHETVASPRSATARNSPGPTETMDSNQTTSAPLRPNSHHWSPPSTGGYA